MFNLRNFVSALSLSFYLAVIFGVTSCAQEQPECDVCPVSNLTPQQVLIDTRTGADGADSYVDYSRPIKDLGTDIVVNDFFTTPGTLYAFMKIVYETIDASLSKYEEKYGLNDRALTLIFKGGNVLRIIANGFIAKLPNKEAQLLTDRYGQDFKRSDADFAVYIDEKRLSGLDSERVFDQIAKLLYTDLNNIRDDFKKNPGKYFDFFHLTRREADDVLKKYYDELSKLPLTKDKENPIWFNANFKQLQLLNDRANPHPSCKYIGQFDYLFTAEDGNITGAPLSAEPSWIINTDNRTLEWPLLTDPNKIISFALIRSKVAFEYMFELDGQLLRKPIGGELIDVSLARSKDFAKRPFLDDYNHNVATYRLASPNSDNELIFKAYSLGYLAHDLMNMLFIQFGRPWTGGPKYGKRVNRLFFLGLIEIAGSLGLGSYRAKNYVKEVDEKLLKPLKKLYPINPTSNVLRELKQNVVALSTQFPEVKEDNYFFHELVNLVDKSLISDPKPDDEEELKKLIKSIEKNMDNYVDINNTTKEIRINPEDLYRTNISHLF